MTPTRIATRSPPRSSPASSTARSPSTRTARSPTPPPPDSTAPTPSPIKDTDGLEWSTVATVTIAVVENPPVAKNDTYSTTHGVTLTESYSYNGVLANDTDPENDSLTASLVSNVLHGTLTFNTNGTFTYTPAAGFFGTDTFTYKATDGLEWSPVATATITVNESPPVAKNDSYSVNHGQTLTEYNSVLSNDTDADGDSITASLVSNVQHGTLTFNASGTFTYIPATGFYGTDTFTYQDTDGVETSTVATVSIAVVENPPVAKNDAYTTAHGQVLSETSTYNGVLGNDTDPENDSLTASLVSNVQYGTLTFNTNGTFTYTPAVGFYGTDTFTYKATDGLEWSGVATASIAVTENPPVAKNDTYSVNHGQTLSNNNVLSNDSDPDNDSITASLVSNVQHGTLTFAANGAFTYTPATGFYGTDTFTYQDTDGLETSTVATVTIAVVENPPVAKNDAYTTAHGQVLSETSTYNGVLGNDTDPENDSLTASLVSNVQHGTLTFNTNGTFTYTPNTGFIGTDTFTYKATDGLEWSGVATASIAVTENPPVAKNDAYSVNHGQTLSNNNVLSNDSDPDGDSITASLVSNVQHGTLTFAANGVFTYIPTAGFYGTDTFTYQDTDGTETSTVATVTIAVVENPPVAKNDAYTTAHGQTLSETSTYNGVLGNDTDPENDSLTASLVSNVQYGTLTFNTNGTFTYTPAASFIGTDTFTYKAFDGLEWSGVATATIAVTENPPVSTNDTYTVIHGQTLTSSSSVLSNDTDPDGDSLTASLVTGVQHGTLSLNPNGNFTYTPAPGFYGVDSFTYEAWDGLKLSGPAIATITVTEHAPVANNNFYKVATGTTLSVSSIYSGVLDNATDADNDTLTASISSNVQHGTLTLNSNGTFTYTPNSGYSGPDWFTFTAYDGLLSSNVAIATIDVYGTAPVAANVVYTVSHDHTLTTYTYSSPLGVLSAADDPANHALTASLVSGVSHGSLSFSSSGTFTYTPTAHYVGSDSFTFDATDGTQTTNVATVTINVVESAPIANNDVFAVAHNHTLTTYSYNGVLTNDSDQDGDSITASVVASVQHGSLSFSSNGAFTYTPTPGYVGTDTFTYQDTDGLQSSGVATVTILVNENPPVGKTDSYSVSHGQPLNESSYYSGVSPTTPTPTATRSRRAWCRTCSTGPCRSLRRAGSPTHPTPGSTGPTASPTRPSTAWSGAPSRRP